MYALASLGLRRSAGSFCVAGAALAVPARGRMYALASLGLCCFLRGRRSTCCSARGRMYALASLGLRRSAGSFCVAGAALAVPARGRMYALASLGLRRSAGNFCVAGAALGAVQGVGCTPWRPLFSAAFCVAGAALGALQGVGCTPWRPLVSAAFAWQAQHLLLCKGSDVRPSVPWSRPLCR